MFGTNRLLAAFSVVVGLMLPAHAMAAFEAYTRADLNLRVGPATTYGVIDVIPAGESVVVIGCLATYEWCDVEWYGLRGWVAAAYLVQPGTTVYLPQWAPQIGLPVISFSFYTYHDRHYRDRSWHRQRTGRWDGRQEVRRPERPRTEQPRPQPRTERPRERPRTEQPRLQPRTERPRERPRTELPRKRPRTEQPRQRPRTEQPRQRPRTEQPRQGQQTEQPRQRQQTEQTRQRQQTEQPGKRHRPRLQEEGPE
jgi:uncharacterized protein YraI